MNFDETMLKRLTKLEREVERLKVKERPAGGSEVTDHGALTGLSDNDHPQYLLTTGKAADSDKLDGIDSTGFATAGHDHDSDYLGITAKAADSAKLGGIDAADYEKGWIPTSGWTINDSANGAVNVPSGALSIYSVGDKVKLTNQTVKYFYIVRVEDNYMFLNGGSNYVLSGAYGTTLSSISYSHAASPVGFPQWFDYVPTLSVAGGTAPTYTGVFINRYCVVGKLVTVTGQWYNASGGTAGAGASAILTTLPVAPKAADDVHTGSAGYGNGSTYALGGIYIYASSSLFSIAKLDWDDLTGAEQNDNVREVYFTFTYEAA